MKVKVGDNVKILCGKDKNKEGKVLKTLKKESRVIVEGINIVKKHMKPNGADNKGGIIERENPIHVSNVKVIEKKETVKAAKKVEAKEVKPATKKTTTAKKTTTKKVKES